MIINVINELIPVISGCLIILTLCFAAVWYMYKTIVRRRLWRVPVHKTHLSRLNAMLKNSPYPVVFRTKDCKVYNKFSCHVAVDGNAGSEVLIIDLE
jgi:hypothetical protein